MREQAAAKVEIPVEAAYQAAQARALRTTEALILAEAQVFNLSGKLERLETENGELRSELADLRASELEGEGEPDGAYD